MTHEDPPSAMNDFQQTIQQAPWTGLIPVGLVILVGLLLWAAGRRVLPACLAMLGLLLGGAVGWVISESINVGIPHWTVAALGAVALALFAALAYRLAVIGALAIVFGLAAPLSVLVVHDVRSGTASSLKESGQGLMGQIRETLSRHETAQNESAAGVQEIEESIQKQLGLSEKGQQHLGELRTMAQRLVDGGKELWSQTPKDVQPTLAASAVLGGFLGIIVGLLMPSIAASAITSMGGSALLLPGAHLLAVRFGLEGASWFPSTSARWLLVWLITSIVGLCLQWIFRTKRPAPADKPA
jgi:hypothetical protein